MIRPDLFAPNYGIQAYFSDTGNGQGLIRYGDKMATGDPDDR